MIAGRDYVDGEEYEEEEETEEEEDDDTTTTEEEEVEDQSMDDTKEEVQIIKRRRKKKKEKVRFKKRRVIRLRDRRARLREKGLQFDDDELDEELEEEELEEEELEEEELEDEELEEEEIQDEEDEVKKIEREMAENFLNSEAAKMIYAGNKNFPPTSKSPRKKKNVSKKKATKKKVDYEKNITLDKNGPFQRRKHMKKVKVVQSDAVLLESKHVAQDIVATRSEQVLHGSAKTPSSSLLDVSKKGTSLKHKKLKESRKKSPRKVIHSGDVMDPETDAIAQPAKIQLSESSGHKSTQSGHFLLEHSLSQRFVESNASVVQAGSTHQGEDPSNELKKTKKSFEESNNEDISMVKKIGSAGDSMGIVQPETEPESFTHQSTTKEPQVVSDDLPTDAIDAEKPESSAKKDTDQFIEEKPTDSLHSAVAEELQDSSKDKFTMKPTAATGRSSPTSQIPDSLVKKDESDRSLQDDSVKESESISKKSRKEEEPIIAVSENIAKKESKESSKFKEICDNNEPITLTESGANLSSEGVIHTDLVDSTLGKKLQDNSAIVDETPETNKVKDISAASDDHISIRESEDMHPNATRFSDSAQKLEDSSTPIEEGPPMDTPDHITADETKASLTEPENIEKATKIMEDVPKIYDGNIQGDGQCTEARPELLYGLSENEHISKELQEVGSSSKMLDEQSADLVQSDTRSDQIVEGNVDTGTPKISPKVSKKSLDKEGPIDSKVSKTSSKLSGQVKKDEDSRHSIAEVSMAPKEEEQKDMLPSGIAELTGKSITENTPNDAADIASKVQEGGSNSAITAQVSKTGQDLSDGSLTAMQSKYTAKMSGKIIMEGCTDSAHSITTSKVSRVTLIKSSSTLKEEESPDLAQVSKTSSKQLAKEDHIGSATKEKHSDSEHSVAGSSDKDKRGAIEFAENQEETTLQGPEPETVQLEEDILSAQSSKSKKSFGDSVATPHESKANTAVTDISDSEYSGGPIKRWKAGSLSSSSKSFLQYRQSSDSTLGGGVRYRTGIAHSVTFTTQRKGSGMFDDSIQSFQELSQSSRSLAKAESSSPPKHTDAQSADAVMCIAKKYTKTPTKSKSFGDTADSDPIQLKPKTTSSKRILSATKISSLPPRHSIKKHKMLDQSVSCKSTQSVTKTSTTSTLRKRKAKVSGLTISKRATSEMKMAAQKEQLESDREGEGQQSRPLTPALSSRARLFLIDSKSSSHTERSIRQVAPKVEDNAAKPDSVPAVEADPLPVLAGAIQPDTKKPEVPQTESEETIIYSCFCTLL